jgi:hypothetical protein
VQSPNRALLLYLHLHANEIARADSLVQADYVRVVDLDIETSKSDNLGDQSGQQFGAHRQCNVSSSDKLSNADGRMIVSSDMITTFVPSKSQPDRQ